MDVTGDPVALIYNKPGDEGSAYTLRLPSGKEVVIGDAEDDYWTLANIIDKHFPTGFVDRFRDQLRSFDIIVTRSAGDDQAVLVMIDGTFDEDGQPPLRVLVNDEPVFSQADFSGDANDEGASTLARRRSPSSRTRSATATPRCTLPDPARLTR